VAGFTAQPVNKESPTAKPTDNAQRDVLPSVELITPPHFSSRWEMNRPGLSWNENKKWDSFCQLGKARIQNNLAAERRIMRS
jgi:hypothetical protein